MVAKKSIKLIAKLSLLIVIASIVSCTKTPNPSPLPNPSTGSDVEKNRWILETMSQVYLYNEGYTALTPDTNLSCEAFFKSLLSSPATNSLSNDGKINLNSGGSSLWEPYSYMERTDAATKATGNTTYGYEVILYKVEAGQFYARVLYVNDNSQAKGKLMRGDWITAVNGVNITESTYPLLKTGAGVSLTVQRGEGKNNGAIVEIQPEKKSVILAAAATTDTNPVQFSSVINTSVGKVGYLYYTKFDTGPKSEGFRPVDGTYIKSLKNVFRDFKNQQIKDLIVDLRYNQGGYVECCRLLASMIAPTQALDKLFIKMKFNTILENQRTEDNKQYKFLKEADVTDVNLNLSRVYILTSEWTASASELLKSTLDPYMGKDNVVLIGDKTEGKNVGSYNYSSTKHKLSLQPIVFQSFNRDQESDNYKEGFIPHIVAIDFANFNQLKEIGDPDEFMLRIALKSIEGVDAAQLSSGAPYMTRGATEPYATLRPKSIGGVIGAIIVDGD